MLRKDLYERFKKHARIGQEEISKWTPLSKNSIRVELNDKKVLVFTYEAHNDWRIETLKMARQTNS